MIIERPRRRGYQLHAPDSPEAEALLIERGLTRPDLDHALAELERTEGIQIRTIVGINDDGVFGSRREGWRPDLLDAYAQPFIPVLWLKVHELLGRVPKGSTARFVQDGTLPGEAQGGVAGDQVQARIAELVERDATRTSVPGPTKVDAKGSATACRTV